MRPAFSQDSSLISSSVKSGSWTKTTWALTGREWWLSTTWQLVQAGARADAVRMREHAPASCRRGRSVSAESAGQTSGARVSSPGVNSKRRNAAVPAAKAANQIAVATHGIQRLRRDAAVGSGGIVHRITHR